MEIVKKKINGEEYFYLQYSFRAEGKVKTKTYYLGKSIPKNIEYTKEKIRLELKKELYEKLENIKKDFQEEWKRCPESAKAKHKEEIAIAFTYNTNAIEGSTITIEEAREIIHDKISPNKPLRDVKETDAHSRVFLEMLDKKEGLTKKLMLQWHKEIFGETKKDIAGKFRDYLVRVGEHRAPDWQDVEKMMDELVGFVKSAGMNAVELSARAHYRFEKIHPFGDGNGRVGRLVMNQILWHKGFPMLIIEYKKRKSYYKALAHDEEGFVNSFLRRYLAVHKVRLK